MKGATEPHLHRAKTTLDAATYRFFPDEPRRSQRPALVGSHKELSLGKDEKHRDNTQ